MHPHASQVSDKLPGAGSQNMPRADALSHLRRRFGSGRSSIRRQFENRTLSGIEAAHRLASLTDEIIATLASYANLPDTPRFCLCATGGYGAELLAPFSDVDLLFLTEDEPSDSLKEQISYVLYTLWDLGLRVGHATHDLSGCLEAARNDLTTCTALLDIRPLYGSSDLHRTLCQALHHQLGGPALETFVHAKIEEREERHHRFGDTPFLVEPHLKEGHGGMRDLQALNWMGHAAFGPLTQFPDPLRQEFGFAPAIILPDLLTERETYRARKAWNFLWTVRLHLHYITGRAEDRLTFDVQPIIGARMGYAHHGRQCAVERFMRHYFLIVRTVMRLTHVMQPAIMLHVHNRQSGIPPCIEKGPEDFQRIDGRLCCVKPDCFETEPRMIFRLLDCARRHQLELHPTAIQQLIRHERHTVALRDDKETSELFLALVCDPALDKTLSGQNTPDAQNKERRFWLPILNETGLLPRLVPAWSRILGQTQFDGYHIYTVDKHSIQAVYMLRQIEAGFMADEIPLAYGLAHRIQTRRALYIATLLHDIGKGRSGDHSEIGASLAGPICTQLGLDADESDTVVWLIAHHLLLSHTAFTRDIDDPQTILDLADTIQSPERLRLLLLLSIADIRAVGPRAWNAWKATLLQRLYTRVATVLDGGLHTSEDDEHVSKTRAHLQHSLTDILPDENITRFLRLGRPGYWLGFDTQTHIRHAQLVQQHLHETDGDVVTIEVIPLPSRGITELTILCPDQPGVFANLAGALALHGASIADARIHTLTNGMILDTFWIQNAYGEAFDEEEHIIRLKEGIRAVLDGRIDLSTALTSVTPPQTPRMEALYIPSRIVINNDASERATVIEINGRDRPALLHDITAALGREGIMIVSAHITTYGLRAVDVFYVHDEHGQKITDPTRLATLRASVMKALS